LIELLAKQEAVRNKPKKEKKKGEDSDEGSDKDENVK